MADIWNDLTDAFNKDMAIDEMRKKYENTYLVIQTPQQGEIVAQYKGYNDGFHIFNDENNMSIKLLHETDYKVICMFPERRLFNFKGRALEFVRSPLRQYRRGICKDNAFLTNIGSALFGASPVWITIQAIKEALYPKYPSIQEALDLLEKREAASVAIGDSFAISQSLTRDKDVFHVFYSDVVIGFFTKGTFFIKHKLFQQEVLDNLKYFEPYRVEF